MYHPNTYQARASTLVIMFSSNIWIMSIGDEETEVGSFDFSAPTARRNALRVLRAMQLSKPGSAFFSVLLISNLPHSLLVV